MSCGRRRAESCPARLRLVGWATPRGVAMWSTMGILGHTPKLVPKRLVPVVQRRLKLVRASANKAEQSNSWSDHRDELLSSCEPSSE